MQKPIRYIAVDDNLVDLLILNEYASAFPFLQHCGNFSTATDGYTAISELQPDLAFLDIEMPGMSGLDLLRNVKANGPIAVFITSHPEFALEGFELSALDYILKPLTKERFEQTYSRIADFWDMKQKAISYEVHFEKEALTIKEGHSQVKLPEEEIIYLEAMQDYTKIVTEKRNYLTLTTLTGFLEKLSHKNFLRVHRSYAVSLKKINEINGQRIICGKASIPVGKTYRSQVARLKL